MEGLQRGEHPFVLRERKLNCQRQPYTFWQASPILGHAFLSGERTQLSRAAIKKYPFLCCACGRKGRFFYELTKCTLNNCKFLSPTFAVAEDQSLSKINQLNADRAALCDGWNGLGIEWKARSRWVFLVEPDLQRIARPHKIFFCGKLLTTFIGFN